MKFFRFFILFPFLVVLPSFAAESEDNIGKFYRNFKAKLESDAARMDKKFFKKVFPKENISKLFEQVLEEEHALIPQTVISKKVRLLSNYPGESFVGLDKKIDLIQDLSKKGGSYFSSGSASPVETWESLIDMNEPFRSFNEEQQLELLMFWRELFRMKVQEHVAYLAGIKPWYSLSVSSFSEYDTNVNRAPDDNAAALDLSGKDDFKQTFVLSFTWKPLDNNKKFNENWKFENKFQGIYLGQSAHKENTMAILDIEPKLTRKLNGWFQNASLAYRYHNFYFDLNYDTTDDDNSYITRQVQLFFDSHRLKFDLESKAYGAFKFIKSQRTKLSLSYATRTYADPTSRDQDANNYILGVSQTFNYGSGNDSFSFGLDYSDFQTDNRVSNDFYYLKPEITFNQKYDLGWKFPISFNEKLSYRYKKWDDFTGGAKTEELSTISITGMTNIIEKLMLMVKVSQTFVDEEVETTPATDTNADQFKAMLGFTWMQ